MGLPSSFRCESIKDGEGCGAGSRYNIVVFDGEPLDGIRFILDYGVPCIEELSYISVFSDLCD